MFSRRIKHTTFRQLREAVWPSMGWNRTFVYVRHRLVRLKDTTYAIAAGLAVGAAISFTPLPGTHFIQAASFSYLLRGNIIAGLIGTAVGNLWTTGPMWWLSYVIGEVAFKYMGFSVRQMPEDFSWFHLVEEITTDPLSLFLPWVVGGFVVALLSWPIFYGIFYWLVWQARVRKEQWKEYRLHKEGLGMTANRQDMNVHHAGEK